MAATPIDLYNDVVRNTLVLGLNNKEPFSLNTLRIYQGSKVPFRWYPVRPTNNLSAPFYTLVSLSGLSLDVVVGARAGAEALLARQNVWTDSGLGYLEATLNLNTTELNAAISTADSYQTYLEINLTDNGEERPTYQEQISVLSVVKGPGTAASLPTSAVEYLTAVQMRAEFVRFFNNPNGATIELLSPDGGSSRLIGCNDNGTAQDELS